MAKFKIIQSNKEDQIVSPLATLGYEELIADKFNGSSANIDDILSYILNIIKRNYKIENLPELIIKSLRNKLASLLGADENGFIQRVEARNLRRSIFSQADPLATMMGGPAMGDPMAGGPAPGMPPGPPAESETIITGPIQSIAELITDSDVVNTIKSNPQLSPDDIALDIWQQYGGTADGKIDASKMGTRVDSDADRDIEQVKKEKEIQDKQDKQYERLPKGQSLEDIGVSLDDLTKAITSMPFSIIQKVKGQSAPAGGGGMPGLMGSSQRLMKKTAKFKQLDLVEISEKKYWA